jgi:hypothetical protein
MGRLADFAQQLAFGLQMRLLDLLETQAHGITKIQVIQAPLGNVPIIKFSKWRGSPGPIRGSKNERYSRFDFYDSDSQSKRHLYRRRRNAALSRGALVLFYRYALHNCEWQWTS